MNFFRHLLCHSIQVCNKKSWISFPCIVWFFLSSPSLSWFDMRFKTQYRKRTSGLLFFNCLNHGFQPFTSVLVQEHMGFLPKIQSQWFLATSSITTVGSTQPLTVENVNTANTTTGLSSPQFCFVGSSPLLFLSSPGLRLNTHNFSNAHNSFAIWLSCNICTTDHWHTDLGLFWSQLI